MPPAFRVDFKDDSGVVDVRFCEFELLSIAVILSVCFCIVVFSIPVGLVSVGVCVASIFYPVVVSQLAM